VGLLVDHVVSERFLWIKPIGFKLLPDDIVSALLHTPNLMNLPRKEWNENNRVTTYSVSISFRMYGGAGKRDPITVP